MYFLHAQQDGYTIELVKRKKTNETRVWKLDHKTNYLYLTNTKQKQQTIHSFFKPKNQPYHSYSEDITFCNQLKEYRYFVSPSSSTHHFISSLKMIPNDSLEDNRMKQKSVKLKGLIACYRIYKLNDKMNLSFITCGTIFEERFRLINLTIPSICPDNVQIIVCNEAYYNLGDSSDSSDSSDEDLLNSYDFNCKSMSKVEFFTLEEYSKTNLKK